MFLLKIIQLSNIVLTIFLAILVFFSVKDYSIATSILVETTQDKKKTITYKILNVILIFLILISLISIFTSLKTIVNFKDVIKDILIPILNIFVIVIFYRTDVYDFFGNVIYIKKLKKEMIKVKNVTETIHKNFTSEKNKSKTLLKHNVIDFYGINIGEYFLYSQPLANFNEELYGLILTIPTLLTQNSNFSYTGIVREDKIYKMHNIIIVELMKELNSEYGNKIFYLVDNVFSDNTIVMTKDTQSMEILKIFNKDRNIFDSNENVEIENYETTSILQALSNNEDEEVTKVFDLVNDYLNGLNSEIEIEDLEEIIDICIEDELVKNDFKKVLNKENKQIKSINLNELKILGGLICEKEL